MQEITTHEIIDKYDIKDIESKSVKISTRVSLLKKEFIEIVNTIMKNREEYSNLLDNINKDSSEEKLSEFKDKFLERKLDVDRSFRLTNIVKELEDIYNKINSIVT